MCANYYIIYLCSCQEKFFSFDQKDRKKAKFGYFVDNAHGGVVIYICILRRIFCAFARRERRIVYASVQRASSCMVLLRIFTCVIAVCLGIFKLLCLGLCYICCLDKRNSNFLSVFQKQGYKNTSYVFVLDSYFCVCRFCNFIFRNTA